MPDDNPLNDGVFDPETITGDRFSNLISRKRVSINGQVFDLSENGKQRREDGTFEDNNTIFVHTDRDGDPLPENLNQITISHSGKPIAKESSATCTSWLHRGNRSRTIALGYDGHQTSKGAICSPCYAWQCTLITAGSIIAAGVFIGLIKGLLNY